MVITGRPWSLCAVTKRFITAPVPTLQCNNDRALVVAAEIYLVECVTEILTFDLNSCGGHLVDEMYVRLNKYRTFIVVLINFQSEGHRRKAPTLSYRGYCVANGVEDK